MRLGLKMKIRLVISKHMDSSKRSEDFVIRFPKKSRDYFSTDGEKVVLKIKGKCRALSIKRAYKEDIVNLTKKLSNKTITSPEASRTGFVTSNTMAFFIGTKSKIHDDGSAYISDNIRDIKIGADPEFVLVSPATGRFVYAAQQPGLPGLRAQLGHDGPCCELRPTPAITAQGLVKNIRKLLTNNTAPIKEVEWMGGACYINNSFPGDRIPAIGGHIHIGDPPGMPSYKSREIHTKLVRLLDESVAVPLARIDTPHPEKRRISTGYGKFGDLKNPPSRVEWRVPSGVWLTHPELAHVVIATTKAVAEDYYTKMLENNFSDGWLNKLEAGFRSNYKLQPDDAIRSIVDSSKSDNVTEGVLSASFARLRGLSTYNSYKEEIERFISIVSASKRNLNKFNLNLKETWLSTQPLPV